MKRVDLSKITIAEQEKMIKVALQCNRIINLLSLEARQWVINTMSNQLFLEKELNNTKNENEIKDI